MRKYQYVLFDLDGTLTDPGRGIRNSVAYALEKMGQPQKTEAELNRFIGPPLQEGFRIWCGMDEASVETAVAYYREYYQRIGMFENVVYEGIEAMLVHLKQHNLSLVVATSKPEIYARQILDHFSLSQYFTYIAGGNLDGTRCEKGEVIRYALDKCEVQDYSTVVMVGDRKHDILGAVNNGIDSIGVLYGYGSQDELEQAGATALAGNAAVLLGKLI